MRYDTLTSFLRLNWRTNQLPGFKSYLVVLGRVVLSERIFSRVTFKTDQAVMGKPLEYELGKWKIPAFVFTTFVSLLSIRAFRHW